MDLKPAHFKRYGNVARLLVKYGNPDPGRAASSNWASSCPAAARSFRLETPTRWSGFRIRSSRPDLAGQAAHFYCRHRETPAAPHSGTTHESRQAPRAAE
jgi:hypothetical protein